MHKIHLRDICFDCTKISDFGWLTLCSVFLNSYFQTKTRSLSALRSVLRKSLALLTSNGYWIYCSRYFVCFIVFWSQNEPFHEITGLYTLRLRKRLRNIYTEDWENTLGKWSLALINLEIRKKKIKQNLTYPSFQKSLSEFLF